MAGKQRETNKTTAVQTFIVTIGRDFRIGEAYRRLGVVYQQQNEFPMAEAALRSALAADEAAFGSDSPQIAQSLRALGAVCHLEGKDDLAESFLERELGIEEKSPVLNSSIQISTMNLLNAVYFQSKEYGKGESILRRELKLLEGSPDQFLVAAAFGALAANYEAERKYESAEKCYLQALALDEEKFGSQNPVLMGPLWSLKELMIQMKRPEEAARFEARRQQIERQLSQKKQIQNASSSLKQLGSQRQAIALLVSAGWVKRHRQF